MLNIYKSCFLIIFLFVSVVQPQKKELLYDKLTTPISTEFYHMPVGLCEDYPEETTTMQIIRNDFEFLKKYGIKFLRISFGWDAIEEVEGKYKWLFWDDYVNMAVNEYGITLIPYICYVPRWNSTGANDSIFFWNYPPKDYEAYGDFVKALVTRYKDKIKTWEVWNEPDIWIYWQGSKKDFAKFIKIAAEAIEEADPEAEVVFPGIAYDANFLLEMFRDYKLSEHFDIVNMHNYYETWHRHPIESIVQYVNEVHDVVWRYGNNQAIWMAEVGYSTFRKGARVSDSYSAYYQYEHTPEYQAKQLFKTLTLVASTGNVDAVAWYEVKDLPPSENVIGDNDNNRYLGVAYPDHRPKPAAQSLQFFNTLFSGKYKSINDLVEVDRVLASESEVQSFETEEGNVMLVSWLKTMIPGRNGNQKDGMAKDERSETISIKIPLDLKGKAVSYEETGNEIESFSLKKNGSGVILENLELTGGNISIIKINK
ncbi:MAG: hypothetical protein ACM34J_14025 [Ignavibacteria bacterium]